MKVAAMKVPAKNATIKTFRQQVHLVLITYVKNSGTSSEEITKMYFCSVLVLQMTKRAFQNEDLGLWCSRSKLNNNLFLMSWKNI